MKLSLSRKGFDSGTAGVPSPIFPDGSMLSLPIPYPGARQTYADIRWQGAVPVGAIVEYLTRKAVSSASGSRTAG